MSPRFALGLLALVTAGSIGAAAPPSSPAAIARAHVQAHEADILREFAALLSLPNVASDSPNIRRNAEHIRAMLERRGLTVELLDGALGPPAVYAERRVAGAKRTLVIYAHYDGQPVVEAQWTTPPFSPVLLDAARPGGKPIDLAALTGQAPRDAFIYARSAGDDKAPIQALASALDALEAAARPPLGEPEGVPRRRRGGGLGAPARGARAREGRAWPPTRGSSATVPCTRRAGPRSSSAYAA